jgi:uncharacterized protein (DUF1697 family)
MTQYVALLRAVNVAGHGVVSMADLRESFASMGFKDVRTLLQTGNVLFVADGQAAREELEARLEAECASRLGLRSEVMIRTPAEIAALVRDNPFTNEARDDPGHLVVRFLKAAVDDARVRALEGAVPGREQARPHGREVYLTYPDGIGRSKLTDAVITSKLGTSGTGRNWNTVTKLAEMVRDG